MPLEMARASYFVSEEELRAAVRRLGDFSIPYLAAEVGLGERATAYRVQKLVAAGIVERTGWGCYAYVEPSGPGAAALADIERRKLLAREELRGNGSRAAPVAGSGARPAPNKEVRKLLSGLAPGASVMTSGSGHYIVETGEGRAVVPSTPSDHRALRNARANLRRIGALEG